jgi:hypothetical protein
MRAIGGQPFTDDGVTQGESAQGRGPVEITMRREELYSFCAEVTMAAIHHPVGAIQAASRFKIADAEIV